ncbi:N-acetylmuramidase family protein [Geomonas ferrireducens]|uniref:N-acetylmuramidase family protein n=1 Tax=Geomonas ferrireducens TaxID=2570227 RepID=UPI0013A5DD90|nr:N-acetylmuramidase family protein [Geomonas ferrireducens]
MIKAFAEVESGGKSGFGSDGLPVIAYEGHIFRRLTKRLHDRHMRLSYVYLEKAGAQWKLNNRSHSVSWQTLRAAMELDANAALQSCSWGKFQIMGFNHKACGFENVLDFVMAMKTGEREQLMGFVKFCKSRSDLISAIMAKDFKKIACLYNGVNYGDCDKRMERSYKKHCNAASSSPKA